jgi:NAD-dependent deacetylase
MSETIAGLDLAAELLAASAHAIALTGAGISVDSNIPAFRGAQGLWDRYDPLEYAHIDAFRADPARVWTMLRELGDIIAASRPNPGHRSLARLEAIGRLQAVITQNVDGLHQRAGSKRVIEFHGSGERLACLAGHGPFDRASVRFEGAPPACPRCGAILKPDVVFFGEAIPSRALLAAEVELERADLVLVLGTSAEVSPAAEIPAAARGRGARVIEINLEPTHLTGGIANVTLLASTSRALPALVETLEGRKRSA